MENYGFIYIWKDKGRKRFYIGSHWGSEDDGYICSSDAMREAYKRRPNDFKRRIIAKIYTNRQDLLKEEQRWLDMIPKNNFGFQYYNINAKVGDYYWWANEETKRQVSKKIKEAMADPEIRKRYLKGLKTRDNKSNDPITKEKKRQAVIKWWEEKSPKANRYIPIEFGSLEYSQMQSKLQTELWKDPRYRKSHKFKHTLSAKKNIGKASKGTKWWNNGTINKRAKKSPGLEFQLGKL